MSGGGLSIVDEGGGGGPKFDINVRREKEAAASVSMMMVNASRGDEWTGKGNPKRNVNVFNDGR